MSAPLAGSDAERRAALALAGRAPRPAAIETFWCHPRWPLWLAAVSALAVAGSLVSVSHAWVATALLILALLGTLASWRFGLAPLTAERASQNVVVPPAVVPPTGTDPPVRLLLTAGYDAPRRGLAQRILPASFGGFGWLAWLVVAMLWVLATALIRTEGAHNTLLGIAQLLPTVALVLAAVLLLDLAIADGAPEPRTAPEAALKLLRALDIAPPAHLRVELVLTGASFGYGLGLREYLRRRRRELDRTNVVVLGLGDDDEGPVRHLETDGPLIPVRFFARLRELARPVSRASAGHGCSAALPARLRGLPAIMLEGGKGVDRIAAALLLVEEIDRYVGEIRRR